MKKNILLIGLAVLMLLGCAKRPESISSAYISHEKYTHMECTELNTKMADAREVLSKFSEMQNSKATQDAWGVFLLAVPFSQLSGDHEAEVAKWKGEVEAIETAQVVKKCKG